MVASEPNPSTHFPIVGLGASAGGLQSLEKFFSAVADDTGMAFVVVTHQHPGRTSLLPELLANHSKIPVIAAVHGMPLSPNRAYIAPAGCCLSVRNETLHMEPRDDGDPRLPIDHFFRSLARHEREQAIAIVLSGTGSDGTLGIIEVKGASGITIAQDPQSAQYPGMPSSAIATKMVDYVLPPDRMPERLVQYVRHRVTTPADADEPDDRAGSTDALLSVLSILRNRSGHDFSSYKRSTIRRRVQRRMNVHGIATTSEYAHYLENTPYEADALFKELLISVTSFFRDPEAFKALETAIGQLIDRRPDDSGLRAWCAGCATGEEAYSLAMIMLECVHRKGRNLRIQVFATDLDLHAIDIARQGRYPDGISADLSPEHLERFFTREENGYRIKKEVRDLVVFATQNVIKDPPFTKVDVVSCRNLLIYLDTALQKRVLSLFAYALRPQGLLMLGMSESTTGFEDRFASVDKKWKLFERKQQAIAELLPDFASGLHSPLPHRLPSPKSAKAGGPQLIERALLTAFAPPTAVVSERGEIIYIHGRTGPFLEPAAGEPSNNIFTMAREGLRMELPAVLRQAALSDTPVVRTAIRVKTNGGFSMVRLSARKVVHVEQLSGTFMVSFELEPPTAAREENPVAGGMTPSDEYYAELELQLQRTRENLQGMIEELETSNEELKSMNEELQSTNEELQSANEELETSREEMQSLNEELQTVNIELEQRNRALSQTNDDMQNLLNSTDVATVFLDEKLSIKRFTTQAKKVFSLIETDIGRPIADLVANLRDDRLLDDAREVLRTLVFHEREIQTKEGSWRLMRIMPYRTHENLIDGLVLTFIDIDRIKLTEQREQVARARAEAVIDAVPTPLLVLDSALQISAANRAYYERFRTSPKLLLGEPCQTILKQPGQASDFHQMLEKLLTSDRRIENFRLSGRFARLGDAEFSVAAQRVPGAGTQHSLLLMLKESK